jgi:hypothetical protein
MNYLKQSLIVSALSLLPYALASWGYVALTDGGAEDFWIAIGVLMLVRLFFAAIEALGAFLVWHFHGRRLTIDRLVALLRSNGFPKRAYAHDNFDGYVFRIATDPAAPPTLRAAAWQLQSSLG